jgi:hypothetical protein
MPFTTRLLLETDTDYNHYEVWDTVYGGRPARVLYSGQRQAAQSGVAHDDNPHLLFDYNQRLFELVNGLQPPRLLLIGGGAYTLPTALLAALPDISIDVVEIDGGLDDIARRFFGLPADPRLRIIHADGRQYLEQNRLPYDMIVVDAFVHTGTPNIFTTSEAIRAYRDNLTPSGLFARNIISAYYGESAVPLHRQVRAFDSLFAKVEIFPASDSLPLGIRQNLLLLARVNKGESLGIYLPYPALSGGAEELGAI